VVVVVGLARGSRYHGGGYSRTAQEEEVDSMAFIRGDHCNEEEADTAAVVMATTGTPEEAVALLLAKTLAERCLRLVRYCARGGGSSQVSSQGVRSKLYVRAWRARSYICRREIFYTLTKKDEHRGLTVRLYKRRIHSQTDEVAECNKRHRRRAHL